ncbi:MAG: DUF2807 domain-containing protein [Weeksellaceae bacterium]|nr:DUF2807 domain-containing protein [Weeksellaceae bacterium]
MKSKLLVTVLSATLVNSCVKVKMESDLNPISGKTEGRENIIEKTYAYTFDEIEVSTSISAEIIKSDEERIVIEAPGDLMDRVKVERDGHKVHIFINSQGIFNAGTANNIRAIIYAKDFSALSADSGAQITLKDKFLQEKVEVNVSSSGSVSGDLEANDFKVSTSSSGDFSGKIWAINLTAHASSSGSINASGKVKHSKIQATSSGHFSGNELLTETADLSASSAGNIAMKVSTSVSADASSGGNIEIKKAGNLKVIQMEEDSGGSVTVSQ